MIKDMISNSGTESQEKSSETKKFEHLVSLPSPGLLDDRPVNEGVDLEFEDWLDSLEENPEVK